jgi:hypothetical protein
MTTRTPEADLDLLRVELANLSMGEHLVVQTNMVFTVSYCQMYDTIDVAIEERDGKYPSKVNHLVKQYEAKLAKFKAKIERFCKKHGWTEEDVWGNL